MHVINDHVFPQEHKATFNATAQTQPTVTCIDCQTGETQSWQTPTTSQLSHNTCAAQQQIDLTKLPQPSQTASYLASIPTKKIEENLLFKNLGITLSDITHLIVPLHAKELEYKDCYTFYHSMRKDVAIGILLNTELARVCKKQEGPHWFKLRASKDFYHGKLSLWDYLRTYGPHIIDNHPPYRDNLLATTMSFPGNKKPGESSLHYFLNNRSVAEPEKIKKIFEGFLEEYAPEILIAENKALKKVIHTFTQQLITHLNLITDRGVCLQLCIPKKLVDNTCYLSKIRGIPQNWKFATPHLGTFDTKLQCYTTISSVLEKYQNNARIEHNDLFAMQARILMRAELFDNPHSGIHMFMWHPFQLQEWNNLKTSIQTIVQDFITNKEVQKVVKQITSEFEMCKNKPSNTTYLQTCITSVEQAIAQNPFIEKLIAPQQRLSSFCEKNWHHFTEKHIQIFKKICGKYPHLHTIEIGVMPNTLEKGAPQKIHALSPCTSLRATSHDANTIALYTSASTTTSLYKHATPVLHTVFSNDNRYLITVPLSKNASSTIHVWDTTTHTMLHTITHNNLITHILTSPTNKSCAVISGKKITLYDITTALKLYEFEQADVVECYAWSPDGSKLATTCDETVSIFDLSTGMLYGTYTSEKPLAQCMWNNTSSQLLLHTITKEAEIINANGTSASSIEPDRTIYSVLWSPHGDAVATYTNDRCIKCTSSTTGSYLFTKKFDHWITTFTFNPQGTHIACADSHNTIHFVNYKTQETLGTLHHNEYIHTLEYTPDGSACIINKKAWLTCKELGIAPHTLQSLLTAVETIGKYKKTSKELS